MISSHFLNRRLVNLLLPFICPRYWWWLTDRKHCCNSQIKKPVSFSWIKHESAAHTCHRWQSVAWKPIMRFDISTLDDVKADTNQTPTKLNRFILCRGENGTVVLSVELWTEHKYPRGPKNRAIKEEQHYTNAGNSLLAKLSQYLLKILHFSLHKKHNSCWARKDLRCKHTIGPNIKSQ